MSFPSRLRGYVSFLAHSGYSPGLGWHTITPDGSRLVRREFFRESSFNCLVTPNDIRIPLEGLDDLDTTVDIFYSRHYEQMEKNIQPGSVVWDIGANLTVASLMFAQHPNVTHIYAFEPMPHTFACAQRSLAANPDLAPKITLEPFGIGDADGELEINYTEKAKAAIGLSEIPPRLAARYGLTPQDMKRISIQILDADRILRSIKEHHPGAPILLKLDAEGAEYGIIDRLSRTGGLNDIAYAVIEWHLTPGEKYLTTRLESAGFQTAGRILEPDNSIGLIDAWR
jgi:FkbM family methyltransferase